MDTNTVITLIGQAVVVIAKLAGPFLVATLIVGLVVSLFQAVTSVQEFTLTFLPKLIVVAAIIAISGHWMVTQMVDYTQQLYGSIPSLLGS
jgi:flagellar biosynthetic protein FliQ